LDDKIKVTFKIFIRKEKKYANKTELMKQLELDRQICLSY